MAIVSRPGSDRLPWGSWRRMNRQRWRRAARQAAELLPPEQPAPPVVVTPPLGGFVGLCAALSVLVAVVAFRPVMDLGTLLLGGAVLFATAYCSVRAAKGVEVLWTAGLFLHLALTFTFGPVGALTAAATTPPRQPRECGRVGFGCRSTSATSSWRTSPPGSCSRRFPRSTTRVLTKALAATLRRRAAMSMTVRAADRSCSDRSDGGKAGGWDAFIASVRSSRVAEHFVYGSACVRSCVSSCTAWRARWASRPPSFPSSCCKTWYFSRAGSARRRTEREDHAKTRRCSSRPSKPAMPSASGSRATSTTASSRLSPVSPSPSPLVGPGKTEDPQLLQAAETLRSSVTDLRTLMIEIAPPDLDQTGVDGALRKLLEPLPARGIEVELDASTATHLPAGQDLTCLPRRSGGDSQCGQPQSGDKGHHQAAVRGRHGDVAGRRQRTWFLRRRSLAPS